MTNREKYLKDGISVEEFVSEFEEYYDTKAENYIGTKIDFLKAFLLESVKPTLTEDEKVILSYINTDIYAKIGRYKNGEIIFRNVHDSYIVLTPYFKLENMFQFIQPRRRIRYKGVVKI